jgi:hypothetical protein
MTTFKMPEHFIYARELIENNGGVWLGVAEKEICEQAHTPGETGEKVVVLYNSKALRDALMQAKNRIASIEMPDGEDNFEAGVMYALDAIHAMIKEIE